MTKDARAAGNLRDELRRQWERRDAAQLMLREAQDELRSVTWETVDLLMRHGMADCFTINWRKVARAIQ